MAFHYLHWISSELRLLVARYLLDESVEGSEYFTASVEMLFHPDSPFALELAHLFPKLSFDSEGVHSDNIGLYRLLNNLPRTHTLERLGRHIVVMQTFPSHPRLFTLLKPYCANLKRLLLGVRHEFEFPWQELVRMASQSLERLTLVGCEERIVQQIMSFTEKFPKLNYLRLELDPRDGYDERSEEQMVSFTEFPKLYYLSLLGDKWVHGNCLKRLSSLLKSLGQSLEGISLGSSRNNLNNDVEDTLFSLLCAHCPNLKDFSMLCLKLSADNYLNILQRYGPQVQRVSWHNGFDEGTCVQILKDCPNARIVLLVGCSGENLDLLQVAAPRVHERLHFDCRGLVGTEVEKLAKVMKRLEYVSGIDLRLSEEQAEQSLVLDALVNARWTQVNWVTVSTRVLSGKSLLKMIPIMPKLSKISIWSKDIEDEEALQEIFAAGINLEVIDLKVSGFRMVHGREALMKLLATFKRIVIAIQEHPNLKRFTLNLNVQTSQVYNEVREVVQILRHRRVELKFGALEFRYGKCISSEEKQSTGVSIELV